MESRQCCGNLKVGEFCRKNYCFVALSEPQQTNRLSGKMLASLVKDSHGHRGKLFMFRWALHRVPYRHVLWCFKEWFSSKEAQLKYPCKLNVQISRAVQGTPFYSTESLWIASERFRGDSQKWWNLSLLSGMLCCLLAPI